MATFLSKNDDVIRGTTTSHITECTSVTQKPNLLSIAPGLRNRIYHYALIAVDGPIELSIKTNRKEPALLTTCRQIRDEAMAMYYLHNNFHVTVCRFVSVLLTKFMIYMLQLQAREDVYESLNITTSLCKCDHPIEFSGPLWLSWLETVHMYPTIMPYPDVTEFDLGPSSKASARSIALGAFEMVQNLQDVPWDRVEKILEPQKKAIVSAEVECRKCLIYTAGVFAAPGVVCAWYLGYSMVAYILKYFWDTTIWRLWFNIWFNVGRGVGMLIMAPWSVLVFCVY